MTVLLGTSLPPKVRGGLLGTLSMRICNIKFLDMMNSIQFPVFCRIQFWGDNAPVELFYSMDESKSHDSDYVSVEYPLVGTIDSLRNYLEDTHILTIQLLQDIMSGQHLHRELIGRANMDIAPLLFELSRAPPVPFNGPIMTRVATLSLPLISDFSNPSAQFGNLVLEVIIRLQNVKSLLISCEYMGENDSRVSKLYDQETPHMNTPTCKGNYDSTKQYIISKGIANGSSYTRHVKKDYEKLLALDDIEFDDITLSTIDDNDSLVLKALSFSETRLMRVDHKSDQLIRNMAYSDEINYVNDEGFGDVNNASCMQASVDYRSLIISDIQSCHEIAKVRSVELLIGKVDLTRAIIDHIISLVQPHWTGLECYLKLEVPSAVMPQCNQRINQSYRIGNEKILICRIELKDYNYLKGEISPATIEQSWLHCVGKLEGQYAIDYLTSWQHEFDDAVVSAWLDNRIEFNLIVSSSYERKGASKGVRMVSEKHVGERRLSNSARISEFHVATSFLHLRQIISNPTLTANASLSFSINSSHNHVPRKRNQTNSNRNNGTVTVCVSLLSADHHTSHSEHLMNDDQEQLRSKHTRRPLNSKKGTPQDTMTQHGIERDDKALRLDAGTQASENKSVSDGSEYASNNFCAEHQTPCSKTTCDALSNTYIQNRLKDNESKTLDDDNDGTSLVPDNFIVVDGVVKTPDASVTPTTEHQISFHGVIRSNHQDKKKVGRYDCHGTSSFSPDSFNLVKKSINTCDASTSPIAQVHRSDINIENQAFYTLPRCDACTSPDIEIHAKEQMKAKRSDLSPDNCLNPTDKIKTCNASTSPDISIDKRSDRDKRTIIHNNKTSICHDDFNVPISSGKILHEGGENHDYSKHKNSCTSNNSDASVNGDQEQKATESIVLSRLKKEETTCSLNTSTKFGSQCEPQPPSIHDSWSERNLSSVIASLDVIHANFAKRSTQATTFINKSESQKTESSTPASIVPLKALDDDENVSSIAHSMNILNSIHQLKFCHDESPRSQIDNQHENIRNRMSTISPQCAVVRTPNFKYSKNDSVIKRGITSVCFGAKRNNSCDESRCSDLLIEDPNKCKCRFNESVTSTEKQRIFENENLSSSKAVRKDKSKFDSFSSDSTSSCDTSSYFLSASGGSLRYNRCTEKWIRPPVQNNHELCNMSSGSNESLTSDTSVYISRQRMPFTNWKPDRIAEIMKNLKHDTGEKYPFSSANAYN